MTPMHTRRDGKLYRYYVSADALNRDAEACPVRRVPAAEIENAVIEQVRAVLRSPEIIVRTWRVARQSMEGLTEADVRDALERLDPLWDELFPAEQARIWWRPGPISAWRIRPAHPSTGGADQALLASVPSPLPVSALWATILYAKTGRRAQALTPSPSKEFRPRSEQGISTRTAASQVSTSLVRLVKKEPSCGAS